MRPSLLQTTNSGGQAFEATGKLRFFFSILHNLANLLSLPETFPFLKIL
jgi:hypothetical protein